MRLIVAACAVLFSTCANAAECFHLEEDPTWTITVKDRSFVWKQGDVTKEFDETSAGTGVMTRLITDGDDTYKYTFHKGDLIVDTEVYVKGCK